MTTSEADHRSECAQRSSVPVRKINLGLLIWPFENDLVRVETPKDNLPLLNNYIGVTHLLNFSMLNRERKRGLIPLKKDEESFGILKERARLWPRTISAKLQASN
jgi:hypothetical protein